MTARSNRSLQAPPTCLQPSSSSRRCRGSQAGGCQQHWRCRGNASIFEALHHSHSYICTRLSPDLQPQLDMRLSRQRRPRRNMADLPPVDVPSVVGKVKKTKLHKQKVSRAWSALQSSSYVLRLIETGQPLLPPLAHVMQVTTSGTVRSAEGLKQVTSSALVQDGAILGSGPPASDGPLAASSGTLRISAGTRPKPRAAKSHPKPPPHSRHLQPAVMWTRPCLARPRCPSSTSKTRSSSPQARPWI
jgi:hypothetical protein